MAENQNRPAARSTQRNVTRLENNRSTKFPSTIVAGTLSSRVVISTIDRPGLGPRRWLLDVKNGLASPNKWATQANP